MFNEAQIPDCLGVFWIQTKITSLPYGLLNLANTTHSTQRTFFSCTLTNFWYFQGKLRGVLCIFVVESLSSLVEVQFFEEWKRGFLLYLQQGKLLQSKWLYTWYPSLVGLIREGKQIEIKIQPLNQNFRGPPHDKWRTDSHISVFYSSQSLSASDLTEGVHIKHP